MALATEIYAVTDKFPDSERFGLTLQMRRAAVSVPSNIAEGSARRSTPEYLRFLSMSRGSLAELDTQLNLAQRLGIAQPTPELLDLLNRCYARLNALIHALERKPKTMRQSAFPQSRIPNPQSHDR